MVVSIGASAFLDLPPAREGATSMQLRHNDATMTGTITGIVDAAAGLVEVTVDGSSEPPVVAASAPGLTFPGAKVKLPRDSSGRVTQVSAPTGQAPEGVEVVPVGETGVRIHETVAGLVEAREKIRQAAERLAALDQGLSETVQAVHDNHAQVVARVEGAVQEIAQVQARADQIADDARTALQSAEGVQALVASDAFVERIATSLIAVKPPNDFPDPYFQDAKGWIGHSFKSDGVDLVPHPAGGAGNAFRIMANGTQRFSYYEPEGHTDDTAVTLVPGATYTLSVFVAFDQPVGDGRLAEIYMRFHTASGVGYVTLTEGINRAIGTPSSMTLLKVPFTMPPDATGPCTFAPVVESPMRSGTVMFSDLRIEQAMWSTLIEPGSITTEKIAAGAVKARTVDAEDVAGAVGRFMRVTTDQIDAGAARIAGPLIADNLTGKTFTGSNFIAGSADGANAVIMGPQRLDVVKNGLTHVRLDASLPNGIAVKSPNSNALLSLASIIFGASGYTWTGTYPPDAQGYSKTTFTASASATGRAMFLIVSSYEVGIQSPIYRWGDIKVNGKRIYETPNQYNESGWRSGQLTMMYLGSGLPTAGTWTIETNLWMGTSASSGFTKWSHRDISAIVIPM